jgi:hypothetical protein
LWYPISIYLGSSMEVPELADVVWGGSRGPTRAQFPTWRAEEVED